MKKQHTQCNAMQCSVIAAISIHPFILPTYVPPHSILTPYLHYSRHIQILSTRTPSSISSTSSTSSTPYCFSQGVYSCSLLLAGDTERALFECCETAVGH